MHGLRFLLPITVALVIVLASSSPVFAQNGPRTCTISVEPQTTVVTVGDTFDVQVWIRGLDIDAAMRVFDFTITWDKTQLEYQTANVNPLQNWYVTPEGPRTADSGLGFVRVSAGTSSSPFSGDRFWLTIAFKCLAPGQAILGLPDTLMDEGGQGLALLVASGVGEYDVTAYPGVAKQREPAPSNPYHYVGGEVFSANKLAVSLPYVGLIVSLAIAAVVIRRKLT